MDVDRSNFEKMYYIHQPVLGVYGTSSKQGKFTLQILIKKQLEERGYCVGALGTEPTSLLLGFDDEYPMGFSSGVYTYGHLAVQEINRMMHEISRKNKDIIIVGGQSGVLPVEWSDVGQMPCRQYDYLLGTHADAVVLCINPYDEIDYIKRTIAFIESLLDGKVLALALFPLNVNKDWTGQMGAKHMMLEEETNEVITQLKKDIQLPILINGSEEATNELCDIIERYFSRGYNE